MFAKATLTLVNDLSDWFGRIFRSAVGRWLGASLLLASAAACTAGAVPPDEDAAVTFPAIPSATPATAAIATSTPELSPKLEVKPTREPAPRPSATPRPAQVPRIVRQDFLRLQEDMKQAIEEYAVPGNYAIAVTDLQTRETISVRGREQQLGGCTLNLFVLLQFLLLQVALDLEAGKYELDRVDRLIRATTWSSNAFTARELFAVVGDGDATAGVQRVAELIYQRTRSAEIILDHPPAFPASSLGVNLNNWTTALGMNRALAALWNGDIVDGELRDYVLERLAEVKPGLNYLTASVPEGTVSHKNGFFLGDNGFVDNDAGIIRLRRGDVEYAYALTFLSEQVPFEFGDVVLAQRLNTMVYEVMAARYP